MAITATVEATHQLTFTAAEKLRDEIDRFAAKTSADLGTTVSRSAAIEMLIRSGLNVRKGARTR
jgi:transcriptional regulatory protein LevR